MITLFRITTLSHSSQSIAFSFLFPAFTKQGVTSEVSKPFSYVGLKWLLSIQKSKNILCPHLILPDLKDGITVVVDCTFTLMNTESFTRNELFHAKGCEFNSANSSHGSDIFIHVEDIAERKFLSYENICVLELTLKNPKILFHSVLILEHKPQALAARGRRDKMLDFRCYNTEKFHYGDFDW
ncbi:unnamed protein product [Soboliphyme baturini]|uniref:MATH domain-containing protein n=1 Tax=Soboliphyme baturini TaxID=241478 RepID=A0A183J556_9BILA|nr:unnamed protein product [Soboliphyme baturini]